MEQSLVKKVLSQLEKDILEVIEVSSISTAKEIANILDVDLQEVIAILNNDDFYNLICANSLGNMRLSLHSKGIPTLIKRLDDERHFIDSYDRLVKATGAVKEKDHDSLKVSLEVLLKDAKVSKQESPHKSSDPDLNTVSKSPIEMKKITSNIFSIEDDGKTPIKRPANPSHNQMEYEFDDEE